MTGNRREWTEELLARGSYRELAERASALADEDPAGTALARAELAWVGAGPVYDLVAAARRAAAEGWPEARTLEQRAPQALLRAGAAGLFAEPEDDGLPASGEEAPIARWRAAEALMTRAAADGDVSAARRWAEAAAAIEGDGLEARRLKAALWQWREGETAEAAERIRCIAGDIRTGTPTPAGRALLADAEAALASIDRNGAGLRWIDLLKRDGLDAQVTGSATAAHALRILAESPERGTAVRATLTVAGAVAAAEAGAAVWIEIEGPVRLAVLRGIEAESGMVLVSWDDRTELMPWARLERLSGVFGLGALVLSFDGLGGQPPPVEADPRLATLDACDLNEEGEAPPRGFVFHTARTALAAEPTWTRSLWRWGRELADAFEQGYVKAEDVFQWYADAREHAAQASWAFTLYATVLAAQDRRREAVMAWRDALSRAPGDRRLAVKCAEALRAAGRPDSALAVLEPALGEDPGLDGAYGVAAQALLTQGDLERARAAAEIELARNPGAPAAVQALVSALERSGDGVQARSALAHGRERNPGNPALALRAAVAASRAGAWAEAHDQATDMLRLLDDANTHALAARLWYCDGDLEGAWGVVTAAHARFPAADPLLTVGAAVLAAWPPAQADAALTGLLGEAPPDVLARWAYTLSEARMHGPAVALADRAAGTANGLWQAARCRLRQGTADKEAVVRALRDLTGSNPGFVLGRGALAAALLPEDPEGALAAVDSDFGDLTPLRWLLEAEALEALGQADEAARVRARLAEAGAAIGSPAVNTARRLGFPALAASLAATARAAGGDSPALIVEQAASLAALGDRDAAAAALAPLATHPDPGSVWPIARTGLAVGAYETVAAVARRALVQLADSRSWDLDDGADPWWYTAALAVAGPDAEARERLETGAPRHPSAWAVIQAGAPR